MDKIAVGGTIHAPDNRSASAAIQKAPTTKKDWVAMLGMMMENIVGVRLTIPGGSSHVLPDGDDEE